MISIHKLLCAVALFFSGINSVSAARPADYCAQNPVRCPETPSEIIFCGDTVRIDNEYLRERFDREILNFVYGHSLTFQILKRSGRYFPTAEAALKANDMPDDLKYLMAIESNLSNRALSTVKAAGLWQFMPATATDYGLTVNDDIDERYDVEKETAAACKYLRQSYNVLGEWAAAAASYNTGRARVVRQKAKQQADSYFEMNLSEETNRYVFRILALKVLMADPAKYGFDLKPEDYYHEMPYDTVGVDSTVLDLASFAKQQHTNYFLLKEANPWLRSNQLPNANGKHYVIKIPKAEPYKSKDN